MEDTVIKFGKRIKYLRKRRGLSAEAFAEYLGVSAATLRRYESGQTEPDAEIAARFSKLLGVSADDMLGEPPSEWVNLFPDGESMPKDKIEQMKANIMKGIGVNKYAE